MKSKKMVLVLVLVIAAFVIGIAANSQERTKPRLGGAPTDVGKPMTSPVDMNISLTAPPPAAATLLAALRSARPETNESMQSSGTGCEVKYSKVTAAGYSVVSGWIQLGTVSPANKFSKCVNLAKAQCQRAKEALLPILAPVASTPMQDVCNQGKLCVHVDTRVDNVASPGLNDCCTPVRCTTPCPWTGYVPD